MRRYVLLSQLLALFQYALLAAAQDTCYYAAGYEGPSNLVPCDSSGGVSTCCLLGDTCLSGNACFNYPTNNTYQYGCTDPNYKDSSCPTKCASNPRLSPWVGLDFCTGVDNVYNKWTCLSPESCACEWPDTFQLLILPSRSCAAMGSDALLALSAPNSLAPYVSLPATYGGSTGYYSYDASAGSVVSTAISGYTPTPFTQFATYQQPLGSVAINPGVRPAPSSGASATVPNGGKLTTVNLPPVSSSPAPTPSSSPAPTTHRSKHTTSPPPSSSPSPSSPASTHSHSTKSSSPSGASSGSGGQKSSNTPVPSGPGGLSSDAKIGIGVGVAVGAIVILAIAGFCLWRRRKNQRWSSDAYTGTTPPPQYPQSPPMGGYTRASGTNNWDSAQPGAASKYSAAAYPQMAEAEGSAAHPLMPEKDSRPVNPPTHQYTPSQSPAPRVELSADNTRLYTPDWNSYYYDAPEVDYATDTGNRLTVRN